jgi:hypothetical protein
LTYLAAAQDGPVTDDRVRHIHRLTLDSSMRFGSVTEKCLHEYAERVEMDPASLTALRLICWMVHARSAYYRSEADVGASLAHEALRHNLFVHLWAQEAAAAGLVS